MLVVKEERVRYLRKKEGQPDDTPENSKRERERERNDGVVISGGFVLIPPILDLSYVCGGLLLCDRVWEPSCTGNSSVQGLEANPMLKDHQGLQRRQRLVSDQIVESLETVV